MVGDRQIHIIGVAKGVWGGALGRWQRDHCNVTYLKSFSRTTGSSPDVATSSTFIQNYPICVSQLLGRQVQELCSLVFKI
jgi:hypothetical protein